jgi:outer membrane protein assembly factor BamB
MTPTLADGKLFVGTHSQASDVFVAIDETTGAKIWQTPMASCVRGEPLVLNGVVYEGESCGDPPGCHDGGLDAFDENTGALLWSWKTTTQPNNGGGQWSPISYDGTNIYFGTGNVCKTKEGTSDAVIALSPSGTLRWSFQRANPISDDDFGGGPMLNNGQIFVDGKDGMLYDIDAASGQQIWSANLGSAAGYGPIGTPTTDGNVLISSRGFLSDPTKTSGPPGGGLVGLDAHGNLKWTLATLNDIPGYAAIANGIAFADLDATVDAIDTSNGKRLWSYQTLGGLYASPALVPSGLYTVDNLGNVYAFSLPSS